MGLAVNNGTLFVASGQTKVADIKSGKTPVQIAGNVFWVDASGLSAGAVTTWVDLASGNSPTQGTSGFRPVATVAQFGGRMSVLFDGVDDFLASAAVATAVVDNFCIGCVAKSAVATASRLPVYNGVGSTNGWGPAIDTSAGDVGFLRGGIAWTDSGIATSIAPTLLIIRRTAGVWSIRWNGREAPGYPLAGSAPTAPATSVSVGRSYASDHWNGYLAEAFIFNVAVSDNDVRQLEYGLIEKWGLTF